MKIIFTFFNALAIFILTVVTRFFTIEEVEKYEVHFFLKDLLKILIENPAKTAIFCGLYIFSYSLFPHWIFPNKEKTRVKNEFIERINTELLGGDLHQHRVTLFREIGYLNAIARYYWCVFSHIFSENNWRSRLYFTWPPPIGKYLIVDTRYGLQYQKSSTMFRVELNEEKACNGIAGYIRFTKASALIKDLPDITGIDFKLTKTIRNVEKSRRKDVTKYMKEGFIKDFDSLRKLHRKARHFYGTIITKTDGSPWGVLLVDSSSPTAPFTPEVRKRFDSFATSLSAIINMGV